MAKTNNNHLLPYSVILAAKMGDAEAHAKGFPALRRLHKNAVHAACL
jgi:hypothetical protein